MFNVNFRVSPSELERLNQKGFVFDESENRICIRGVYGDALLEIIQLNYYEVLIMSEEKWVIASDVKITSFFSGVVVFWKNDYTEDYGTVEVATEM